MPNIVQVMEAHFGARLHLFGNALAEMGEHQKRVEDALGGQMAGLRAENLRNVEEMASKLGRVVSDSMIQVQQNITQLAAAIPPPNLSPPQGGRGGGPGGEKNGRYA
jgi:hypothetical protein